MKIFAIGDLHLSFCETIEKPMDIFGESWEDHASRLEENWRKVVSEDDVVIICGDISWGLRLEEAEADFRWIARLPGKKLIFKGNHDLWWQSAGKLNSLYGDDKMIFMQNNALAIQQGHTKIAICGTRGWSCPGEIEFSPEDQKVYDREVLRLEMSLKEAAAFEADKRICAMHFPPTNDNLQASDFTRLMSQYGVDLCLYGHLHGQDSFKRGLKGILNGVRYELVSLDYLEACPKEVII